jgi:hypothetical protein
MLPQLEAILRASAKVITIDVLDNDPIDADNFLFKLRCQLTTGTKLQIRLRAVAGHLHYSYQEFDVAEIQRWDNAPHFPHLKTHPHHYHDPQGNVLDSPLSGDPLADLPIVLSKL